MEVLEPGEVAAHDDQVHRLGVLDLELGDRSVLAVDAEPVAPGTAGGGRVRRGEQPVVGVGGREAGDHPLGHPGLVLGGGFGVGEPGRLGGGADGHTDAEHSGQPGGVEGELVGGAHGGQASS